MSVNKDIERIKSIYSKTCNLLEQARKNGDITELEYRQMWWLVRRGFASTTKSEKSVTKKDSD